MDETKQYRLDRPVEVWDGSTLDTEARKAITAIETGAIHDQR